MQESFGSAFHIIENTEKQCCEKKMVYLNIFNFSFVSVIRDLNAL